MNKYSNIPFPHDNHKQKSEKQSRGLYHSNIAQSPPANSEASDELSKLMSFIFSLSFYIGWSNISRGARPYVAKINNDREYQHALDFDHLEFQPDELVDSDGHDDDDGNPLFIADLHQKNKDAIAFLALIDTNNLDEQFKSCFNRSHFDFEAYLINQNDTNEQLLTSIDLRSWLKIHYRDGKIGLFISIDKAEIGEEFDDSKLIADCFIDKRVGFPKIVLRIAPS